MFIIKLIQLTCIYMYTYNPNFIPNHLKEIFNLEDIHLIPSDTHKTHFYLFLACFPTVS